MEILRRTPWSRIREQNSVYKEFLEIVGNGETNGQCVKGDNCSFRHDINKRGKVTPSIPSPNSFMQQNERKSSKTRSPRGKSPSGRMSRWPCKGYRKGTCNNSFCEKWHPPECLFYKTKSGCRFGEKCSFAHRQVDEQPSKRSKKNDDKSAVAMLKNSDWHENVRQPVVNLDKSHDRSGRPDNNRINDANPVCGILEGLYKSRTRESEAVKTVLELYSMEIHQKKAGHDCHRLKTIVKRSIEQNLRMNNF